MNEAINQHYQSLIGRVVVLRDDKGGVYLGRLVAIDAVTGVTVLANARQAHRWLGAAATPGLAVRGPTGGRIGPEVETIIQRTMVSVIPANDEAIAKWAAAAALAAHGPPPRGWLARLVWAWRAARTARRVRGGR